MRFETTWRRRLVMAVLVLTLGIPASAFAGEIRGTVSIKSSLRPRATGKASSSGSDSGGYGYGGSGSSTDDAPPVLSRDQEIQYVVVSVVGKNLPATAKAYVMRQKTREFVPHVLPVVRGSTVVFTNDDPYLHSIYSESSGGPFNLPKYARGKKESRVFSTPGPVELFCNIHSRMNAYIYVVDNDYFAQPGADHRFTIANLPAGTYTLKIWHPRANPQSRTVTVPASGAATADVSL